MNTVIISRMSVKKPFANVNDWMIADGKRDTMLAKMSSDMPLPMPRWVMSSPIHMMKAVPAIRVTTMTTFVKKTGGAPGPLGTEIAWRNTPSIAIDWSSAIPSVM